MFFFPFLLCAAPFLFGFFILLPMRILFGHHPMMMGHFRRCHEEGFVPPPVEEWHRRMHETKPKE
jgi:hypothetical protein